MKDVVITFDSGVRTKSDILHIFEESALNFEKSAVRNWDALDEIITDAIEILSMRIIIHGLEESTIDSSSRNMLKKILARSAEGSVIIEG